MLLKLLFSLTLMLALAPAGVAANELYNSRGFESPTFAVGSLVGQENWASNAVGDGGNSTALVFDAAAGDPVKSGSQSVRVFRDGNDAGGSTQFSVPLSANHGQTVLIQWDMYAQFSGNNGAFGPGFSLESYVNTASGLERVSGVGVDSADGSFYEITGNASEPPSFSDQGLLLNAWQAWQVELDFMDEVYFVSVDGISITPSGGASMLENVDYAAGDRLAAASLVAFATDGNALGQAGTAFVDNFRIQSIAVVPEPTATVILGAGLLGLALRRRLK